MTTAGPTTDELAMALMARLVDDIGRGRLTCTKIRVDDEGHYELQIYCVGGPALAPGYVPPGQYRPPTTGDACPKCLQAGSCREVGGVDWLCIACQHSWAPFPAPR